LAAIFLGGGAVVVNRHDAQEKLLGDGLPR